MKTRYQNIGLLDMRGLTEEKVESIHSIRDIGVVLINEETKALFQRVRTGDVGAVICVPKGCGVVQCNGKHRVEAHALQGGESVYLMVNGVLEVAREVTPELLRATVVGGSVNGKLFGTVSQVAALHALGLSVNGTNCAYPDDCALREGGEPMEPAEARRLEGKVYLLRCVELREGVLAALEERGVTLYGNSGLAYPAAEYARLKAVWQGTGKLIEIPEGYRFVTGDLQIDKNSAYRLRGKLMVHGDLELSDDLPETALAALEAIHVRGEVRLRAALLDALLPKLEGDPEIQAYDGVLLSNDAVLNLTAEMLQNLSQPVTLYNCGQLSVAKEVSTELLLQKVCAIRNNGMLRVSAEQYGAILPRLTNTGHVSTEQETRGERADKLSSADENVVMDVGSYIL